MGENKFTKKEIAEIFELNGHDCRTQSYLFLKKHQRLIASAPDLLEACERMEKAIESYDIMEKESLDELYQSAEMARKAIAKAKSEAIVKIPKSTLIHESYYFGQSRNADIARWNAETQLFYYWRQKFGLEFIETICHFEDDEDYDVFIPEGLCDNPIKEIPFIE